MRKERQEDEKVFGEWLLKRLARAYREARKGKRKTDDEHSFELNESENLIRLRDTIMKLVYKPSRGVAFITMTPVIREIFAAPFRDRIIHHLLFGLSADWWDRRLIHKSGSCRKGKGTLFMIKALRSDIQAASNNYKDAVYVIKLDIQGYFMSLVREKLYEQVCWGLGRQFPNGGAIYRMCKMLWAAIIFDNPVENVKIRGKVKDWEKLPANKSLFNQVLGVGIVIGNLTSQLLSNIFMDKIDRFITFDLGYRHYGRYVDDLYLVVKEDELERVLKDIKLIGAKMAEMGLKLHPKKIKIQGADKGVEFLGMVIYKDRIQPGTRLKCNFRKVAKRYVLGVVERERVVSYLGHLKYCNHIKFIVETFEGLGVELPWIDEKDEGNEIMRKIDLGIGQAKERGCLG